MEKSSELENISEKQAKEPFETNALTIEMFSIL